MTIGEFLRHHRKKLERSLRWVALKADISSAYLSDIENGKKPAPANNILERLSRALSLSKEEETHLFRLALLDRTPKEIRDELWKLEENQKKLEAILNSFISEKNSTEILKSFIDEFSSLSPENIKEAITFIEFLKYKSNKNDNKKSL